ncbi:MAG: hypothetical protein J7513_07270 [Solirubrobacteraceae bacterium]|nr:hypothetical protein [Solirubrobacteraceae bacterium]
MSSRTYIRIEGTNHIVEGTVEEVVAKWERAKRDGTMLWFHLPESTQVRAVNPSWVEAVGAPLGGGGTLTWAR